MATIKLKIHLNKAAREFLVNKGFDPAFGARPLKRALQKYLEDPIAEEILRNKFGDGSVINVRYNAKIDGLKFSEGNPDKKGHHPVPETPVEEPEKPGDPVTPGESQTDKAAD